MIKVEEASKDTHSISIKGSAGELLMNFASIVDELLATGIPEEFMDNAFQLGKDEFKKRKKIKNLKNRR